MRQFCTVSMQIPERVIQKMSLVHAVMCSHLAPAIPADMQHNKLITKVSFFEEGGSQAHRQSQL